MWDGCFQGEALFQQQGVGWFFSPACSALFLGYEEVRCMETLMLPPRCMQLGGEAKKASQSGKKLGVLRETDGGAQPPRNRYFH